MPERSHFGEVNKGKRERRTHERESTAEKSDIEGQNGKKKGGK